MQGGESSSGAAGDLLAEQVPFFSKESCRVRKKDEAWPEVIRTNPRVGGISRATKAQALFHTSEGT